METNGKIRTAFFWAACVIAAGFLAAPGRLAESEENPQHPQASAAAAILPGHRETLALAEAYPDRILERSVRNGQWAVRIGDAWYSWAEGRLLPENETEAWETYVPLRFYSYYPGPRQPPELTQERLEALRARNRSGNTDPRPRSNAFLDALYGISSASQAERTMEEVPFLGKRVRIHPLLISPLARVEARIQTYRFADPAVRAFLDGIAQVQGYNWREIAGTERRSYHGYGVALDIIPRSFQGRFAYWRWAFEAGVEEWWSLGADRIWTVPSAVMEAFEAEGFVWGGKWLWFDTIHFEYRPEVFRLMD